MVDNVKLLGDAEYEIIELLQSLKVPRTESISIACLLCGEELTSQTIERSSGLKILQKNKEVMDSINQLRELRSG
jgi:predicted transcriptional regulator